jgi:cell division protein ZapA
MAHVIVEVNGRPYTMQCPDGEEEHLKELARLLDAEVVRIRHSVGTVGDIRLLVMAGLMVADRLSESILRIEELEEQVRALRSERDDALAGAAALEQQVAERLDAAAAKMAAMAKDMDLD